MTTMFSKLDRLFLTDGGLETDMIFKRGIDLPHFASITLLRTPEGRNALEEYYRAYLDLAKRLGTGFELVSASWRASSDWAFKLGLTQEELDALNGDCVELLLQLRDEYQFPEMPIIVSGCIGPRGDGYDPGRLMTAQEAQSYHSRQVATLVGAGVDMISAITMTNVPEATGVARAAQALGKPVVISFTVETDGMLPAGDTLSAGITAVDEATNRYPAYFMVNCAHPDHFASALLGAQESLRRIQGIRANASRCSHAELDVMTDLDEGNPPELGQLYRSIRDRLPQVRLLGGCCGTDIRHLSAIGEACAAPRLDLIQPATA